jgi:trehalose/maltose transport system substrate-binding protein
MYISRVRHVRSWLRCFPQRFVTLPRLTALLTSLVLASSGCRQSAPSGSETTITLIDWIDKQYQDPDNQEISEFTRETGIRVKVLPSPEGPVEQLATWTSLVGRKAKVPDVYAVDVIWPKILADGLIDLKDYVPAQEIAAHSPELIANNTVDGRVVALPYHVDVGLLYYRTDLLLRYGFRNPPKTWDELEDMAARIQAGERAKGRKDFWGFIWQGARAEVLTCNGLEWQKSQGGGAIIDNGRITVDNPETIHAWERAARWVGSISPPGVVAYQEWDTQNIWKAGGAAFMRSWNGWMGPYRSGRSPTPDADANNYDVAPLPAGKAGSVGALGGHSYGVSKYSAHVEAAVKLVRYLCRRDVELKRLRAYSGLPTSPALYQDPAVRAATPYLEAVEKAYKENFAARPSATTGNKYPEVSRAYFEAVHSVLTRQKTAAEAAANLREQLVRITGFDAQSALRKPACSSAKSLGRSCRPDAFVHSAMKSNEER